jgi:hypothetical protein
VLTIEYAKLDMQTTIILGAILITDRRQINISRNTLAEVARIILNLKPLVHIETETKNKVLYDYCMKRWRRGGWGHMLTWLHLTRMTASNPWGLLIFHLRSLNSLAGSERAENGK